MFTTSSEFVASTGTTLVLAIVDWVDGPHAMHQVLLPWFTCCIQNSSAGFRCKFWHAPDHVGVPLEEISPLEMFQIDVGEVPSQIVFKDFMVGSVRLRLIVVVARLPLMVVRRNHLREGVLLLEATIHVSWLVPPIVEVTMLDSESILRRLHIVITVCLRIFLPSFGNLDLFHYGVLRHNQFIEVGIACWLFRGFFTTSRRYWIKPARSLRRHWWAHSREIDLRLIQSTIPFPIGCEHSITALLLQIVTSL